MRYAPTKKETPNFQRQHYLYWCNVYNLSHGSHKGVTGHHHSSSGAKVRYLFDIGKRYMWILLKN